MNACRSDGELRAYRDGELAAAETQTVAGHVAGCEACARRLAEVSARAERILTLLNELPGAAAAPLAARGNRWRWAAAGMALAAGLAIGFLAVQKEAGRGREGAPRAPQAAMASGQPRPAAGPENRESQQPALTASARPAPRAAKAKPREPAAEYFYALDDGPIEMGVIQRVTLGPAAVPADVIYSPDGRARAVRLVSDSNSGGELQ